jgi:hypothetical protein
MYNLLICCESTPIERKYAKVMEFNLWVNLGGVVTNSPFEIINGSKVCVLTMLVIPFI